MFWQVVNYPAPTLRYGVGFRQPCTSSGVADVHLQAHYVPNLQAGLRDVELTPDPPPKCTSLPLASSIFQYPITRLFTSLLATTKLFLAGNECLLIFRYVLLIT